MQLYIYILFQGDIDTVFIDYNIRLYICIYVYIIYIIYTPAGHCLQFNCDNEVAPVTLEYDPEYIIDRHIYYIKIHK